MYVNNIPYYTEEIKTFQKKVIITAMTAITILLAVFIGAINIVNYIYYITIYIIC